MQRPVPATLALLCITAGSTGCVYSPAYVGRVLVRRDANTDDYKWKKSWSVPASKTRAPLPSEPSRLPETARTFSAVTGQSVDAFMSATASRSLLVVHDGRIVLESYANGGAAAAKQATFSVTKSVLSLLVGRAPSVSATLDEPVTNRVPELLKRDQRFAAITLSHLLEMRSGLAYSTRSSFPWVTNDAPLVYYARNLRTVVRDKTKITGPPGSFHYNDFNPNLLALALERPLGPDGLKRLLTDFWNELGAEDDALLSTDDRGFGAWDSGFVATARDLAKVGLLLSGTPSTKDHVVPDAWRARIATLKVAPPTDAQLDGRQWAYQAGWWHILRPDGNNDLAAIGRFGQFVYVSPAHHAVIVRTGHENGAPSDRRLATWFYALVARL